MANQVTWTKEQRAKAKELGLPLVAIAFDDTHLTKEQGGKRGRAITCGPSGNGEMVWKALMDHIMREAGRRATK